MRGLKGIVVGVVAIAVVLGPQPAGAAQPSPVVPTSAKAPIASVGSRLDSSLPATRHGPPAGLPYRVLDQAAFARAKAQAQQGGAYARSDFAISATPGARTVVQGQSTTYTVTTQATSGASRPVTLSIGGLPAGATGTFDPATVNAGGSAILTVSTTAATPVGTVGLVITGTYSSPPTTHTTGVSLTVTASATDDFSISASPATQGVVQGSSTMYTVSTQVASGVARTVSLSLGGLPAGATGTFSPAALTAGNSSLLTVATTAATATGTFTLTITGQYASGPTHATTVALSVTAAVPDDFSISAAPTARTVVQGQGTTYTVDTQVTSGSAQTVSLSIGALPAGATATFAPTSITAGQSSTLTIATTASAATGVFTLTITGQSAAGPTHSTSVTLEITATAATGPTIGVSWNGQSEADLAPPDPTGAIGPNTYIQLINLRYGIYGRDGSLLSEGDLGELTHFPVNELSDPQIVWDPTSGLFYYLVLDVYSSAYAFGYSKSSDPRSADDWCRYIVDGFYSPYYTPDYPKMAVTQDFVLVGANVFLLLSFYVGSDVDWFLKPTDPVCPAQLGPGGIFGNVKNANGTQTSTPEPAVSADATSGGWIVGSADVGTGSASFLSLFKVTKNAQGSAAMSAPTPITVPSYQMPANAPQSGTTQRIDTMDTRLTHAVAGYDPRIGSTAIWTAHTVFGGAGAEGRWYEIGTGGAPHVSQSGTVSDAELYVFNGAISPDRAADDVTDANATTGRNMVMGFNTSSPNTFAAIQMVSQHGTGAQTGFVLVRQSVGPYVDFACGSSVPDVCRWGDYGGAAPDPRRSMGGQVWLSGEWNDPMTDGTTPTWQTWNWSATP